MKKLASLPYDVVDYVTEGNIEYLAQITKGDETLIKNAYIPTLDDVQSRPSSDFALVLYHPHLGRMHKLATYDKYLTQLNMRIFSDLVDKLPDEIVKTASYYLVKAGKYYRLPIPEQLEKHAAGKHITNTVNINEIDRMAWSRKQRALQKEAEQRYALPEQKKYPITTPGLIKKAMQYFKEHEMEFAPKDRFSFGTNAVLAAKEMNLEITGALSKFAGERKFNSHYQDYLNVRKSYSPKHAELYQTFFDEERGMSLEKVAEDLEALDRKTGLARLWNRGIADPYETVFEFKKEACSTYKGKTVTVKKLAELKTDVIDADLLRDLGGPEGLEIFESLPIPVKNKLADLL